VLTARGEEERARHGGLAGAFGRDEEAANPAGDDVEDWRWMDFSMPALRGMICHLE
jgi:hypothetical protein